MNRRKIIIFLVVPFALTLPLIALYFSGVDALQGLITPEMPDMHPNSGREFGLLENLQNVLLLMMLGVAVGAIWKKQNRVEKFIMAGIAAFTVVVFLEEIDYGLHYYEYAMAIPADEAAEVRNLHNQGDRTQKTKMIVDIGMVLWFVVAPIALRNSPNRFIRYFRPDVYSIYTMIAMFVVRTIAHSLEEAGYGEGGGIQSNISEFREVVTYYIFLLYVITLGQWRSLGEPQPIAAETSRTETA